MRKRMPGGLIRWCLEVDRGDRNRRAARRFAAMSRPALIGWVDGEQFITAPAALKDVSLSGLSALADLNLPEGATVWVSLNDQHAGRWVKAVVVAVQRVRRLLTYRESPRLIRMRFGLGCPYTFFHAAVGAVDGSRASSTNRTARNGRAETANA